MDAKATVSGIEVFKIKNPVRRNLTGSSGRVSNSGLLRKVINKDVESWQFNCQ